MEVLGTLMEVLGKETHPLPRPSLEGEGKKKVQTSAKIKKKASSPSPSPARGEGKTKLKVPCLDCLNDSEKGGDCFRDKFHVSIKDGQSWICGSKRTEGKGSMKRKQKTAKRANEAKEKKPEPGICQICGCTEENACEGGCHWADETRTICSACVEGLGKE